MSCDRKCESGCSYFLMIGQGLIATIKALDPDSKIKKGDATCTIDPIARVRHSGDPCLFIDPENKIDPES